MTRFFLWWLAITILSGVVAHIIHPIVGQSFFWLMIAALIVTPPSLDPAIKLKEWTEKRHGDSSHRHGDGNPRT